MIDESRDVIPALSVGPFRARPISFGGGVNSIAMTIMLVNEGWRGDIVFADTGVEWPETYCFIDYFESDWLEPRGLGITRLDGSWRKDKRAKTRSLIKFCETFGMVPLIAVRWCTRIFKIEPGQAYHSGRYLYGFAADEAWRQKGRLAPLIEAGIDREGCIAIIQAQGLDVPQRSHCYICPFQSKHSWKELWRRHPDLIERAARLEEIATERVRKLGKNWKTVTIDPGGKITIRQRILAYESQIELPSVDMTSLLRFRPCICGL